MVVRLREGGSEKGRLEVFDEEREREREKGREGGRKGEREGEYDGEGWNKVHREVMNDGERKGRGDTHTYSYS